MDKEILSLLHCDSFPIIPAKELDDKIDTLIMPCLDAAGEHFILETTDGHKINGMAFSYEKVFKGKTLGTVMISHGFVEAWQKFREIIFYFLQAGYDVCIHDHRGHGGSRDGKPGGTTHVEHFQDYVDDFDAVVKAILPKLHGPSYVYAHSMGGLIACTYIQQHPTVFTKAVLSAPMFEINRGGLPYPVAKATAAFLCLIGKDQDYLPGQTPYDPVDNFEASASSCKERHMLYRKEMHAHQELQSNGASCRWALESFKAGELLLKKNRCACMKLPILLFQAGLDTLVLPGAQDRFISQVPNGRLIAVPDCKHELFMTPDKTMAKYVRCILDFMNGTNRDQYEIYTDL